MLEAINTWDDYRTKIREFDAVLEYGKAVAAAVVGQVHPTPHARYGEQVFNKLMSHGIALRSLAADPQRRTGRELWDVPSLCALARCAVEAHDAFEYIAGHDVAPAEREFRVLLWELHDATRRLKMADAADPLVERLRTTVTHLKTHFEVHAFLASLHPRLQDELRGRVARGEPPAFHLDQRQRCALSGVDAQWHHAVTMQLSQHAHTLPSSVHELATFQGGTPQALRLLAMPVVFTLPFLVRSIQAMDALTPWRPPEPPSRTARTMALWRAVAEPGAQHAA